MKYAMLRGENIVAIYENPSPEDVSALGLVGLAHQGQIPPQPSQSHVLRVSGGTLAWVDGRTLAQVKAQKNAEINTARLAANRTTFTFGGKAIACDELSRGDIDGVNGIVTLTGALPPGWPGGWKAVDNSVVLIPDVLTWTLFYGAMVAQGTANFNHAQALKATLAAATTIAEVEAIQW